MSDEQWMDRQEMNRALVRHLAALVEAYPDQRFGQLLQNHGFIHRYDDGPWQNEFYLEPDDLLKRVRATQVK